jgi:hypothetical protein
MQSIDKGDRADAVEGQCALLPDSSMSHGGVRSELGLS